MGNKILVIDDDYDMLGFLGILLHEAGFDVLQAASPFEGLKLAREEKPDLVVLDIMMPEMDGWEVCRRLRKIGDMPIMFLTVLRDPEHRAKGMILGDDYIMKPFDSHELLQRIKALMERWITEKRKPEGG
jgi:two-component system KDP operon response regulator KdpE